MELNASLDKSPLNVDCETAIAFVMDYMKSENCPPGLEALDLTSLTNSAFLDKVSEMMLVPALTECIGIAFYPVLPDLVGRWALLGHKRTKQVAAGIARLIHLEPRLKRYTLCLCFNLRYAQELILPEPSFLQNISHLTPESSLDKLLVRVQLRKR